MKAGYNRLSSQERSWGARTQHLCLCHLRLSRERQCGRWLTTDFGVSRVALDLGPRIPPPSGPRFAPPHSLASSDRPSSLTSPGPLAGASQPVSSPLKGTAFLNAKLRPYTFLYSPLLKGSLSLFRDIICKAFDSVASRLSMSPRRCPRHLSGFTKGGSSGWRAGQGV